MSQQQLSFASAEELFEALAAPDAIARRNVLGWVATHPQESIVFGTVGGRDVLDVLLGLINRDWDYPYWEDVAIAIGAFDATRVTEFFVDLLATATDSGQASDAATALERRRGAEGLRERLVEILFSDGPRERLAAAAEVLAGEPGLPDEAAIRVAALEDECEAPPITEQTVEAWLRELSGPFGPHARDRLELQGPPAISALAERWEALEREDREWLVDWATEAVPEGPEAAAIVSRALASSSEELALSTLLCAARLPDGALAPESLAPWAEHESPELRAAAIAAGGPADVDAVLASSNAEPEVLVATLHRVAERRGAEAAAAIAPHLGSDSLEVRNAARSEIVVLGPVAIEPLRPLVRSSSPETRAAAVRALLDLGDDDWLANELLA